MQVGLRSAGLNGTSVTALSSPRSLAAYVTAPRPRAASTLVSILFLSDGHQTRGILSPLAGADKARAAGIPVYTVALGTTGNTTMRGFPGSFNGGPISPGGSFGFGQGCHFFDDAGRCEAAYRIVADFQIPIQS